MDETQPSAEAQLRALLGDTGQQPALPFPEAPNPMYSMPAFAPDKEDIASKIRNSFQQYVSGFNTLRDAMTPKTAGDVGEMALYSTPVVGEALSAKDAVNSIANRDWSAAALSALGVLPLAGGMIKAFHGSPHNFDAFDMSKIGTGEGAQAYGHGLYFAENPRVAGEYRRALSGSPQFASDAEETAAQHLAAANGDREKAISDLDRMHSAYGSSKVNYGYGDAAELLRKGWSPQIPGKTYEVNINADPEHFVDLDAPLQSQHQKVRDVFASHDVPETFQHFELSNKIGSPPVESIMDVTGLDAYNHLAEKGGPEEASRKLYEAGIPGVKYLDQGSRAAGEGSRNYVVFDQNLINIVRKYGIPGAIGLGLITPEIGRQMEEQGF